LLCDGTLPFSAIWSASPSRIFAGWMRQSVISCLAHEINTCLHPLNSVYSARWIYMPSNVQEYAFRQSVPSYEVCPDPVAHQFASEHTENAVASIHMTEMLACLFRVDASNTEYAIYNQPACFAKPLAQ
jgi:hypothetical protein